MILLRLLIKMPPNRRPTLSCSGSRRWTRHSTTAADGATRLRGTEHSVFSWRMAVQALCWMAWHPPSHVYMCNRHDAELILHVPLTILLVLREASHGSAQRCLAVNGWAPPDPISGRAPRRTEGLVRCPDSVRYVLSRQSRERPGEAARHVYRRYHSSIKSTLIPPAACVLYTLGSLLRARLRSAFTRPSRVAVFSYSFSISQHTCTRAVCTASTGTERPAPAPAPALAPALAPAPRRAPS